MSIVIVAQTNAKYFPTDNVYDNNSLREDNSGILQNVKKSSLISFKGFDYSEIYTAIKNFVASYGGLKIRVNEYDSYINATFWGVQAVYVIGKVDNFLTASKLERFLNYTYDEETGGFRDYLEGDISLVATAYGLMIQKVVNKSFSFIDKNKTEEFILSKLIDNQGFGEDGTQIQLYPTTLGVLALYALGENMTNYTNLIDTILSYKSNGFFNDNNSDVPRLLQTYFALKALKILGYDISLLKNEITNSILSLFKELNTTVGGFGETNATTFETFLALDILNELTSLELVNRTKIINFLEATYTDGKFATTSNSSEINIFSVTGGILSLYVTSEIYENFEILINLESGTQIPIDLNSTIIRVKIDLEDQAISNLNVFTNVSGKLIYDSQKKEYVGVANFTNLSFGSYKLEVLFNYTEKLLSNTVGRYYTSFRIGYNISVLSDKKTYPPGGIIRLNISVTYHNGTYVNGGHVNITIYKANISTIFSSIENLTGGLIERNITVPNDSYLGYYQIFVYVNDSHGVNHTVFKDRILISDNIKITYLTGNETEYHLGESFSVNVSLVYNNTNAYVPEANASAEMVGDKTYSGNVSWFNASLIVLSFKMPEVIPTKDVFNIRLTIKWDEEYSSKIAVTKINVTIDDLMYIYEGGTVFEIGDETNVNVSIIANTTQKLIQNATIRFSIMSNNESCMVTYLTYNETFESYPLRTYVDPNILQGTYNISVEVFLPFNNTYLKLPTNVSKLVEIRGILSIDNDSLIINPEKIKINDVVEIKFKVKNTNTGKYVVGLKMFGNVTSKDEKIIVPVGEKDGLYSLTFEPSFSGTYKIELFRSSDNSSIGSITITVYKEETSIYDILEPYVSGLLWSASLIIVTVYLIARYFIGKRISKRYLIRRAKKKR